MRLYLFEIFFLETFTKYFFFLMSAFEHAFEIKNCMAEN